MDKIVVDVFDTYNFRRVECFQMVITRASLSHRDVFIKKNKKLKKEEKQKGEREKD